MTSLSYGPFISCKQAKEQGLRHYFTGKPCKHGHIDLRLVSSETCFTCHRDRQNADRKTRPEVHIARKAAYYATNKEAILQQQKDHYHSSPERRAQSAMQSKQWRKANPEKCRAQNRKYYAQHVNEKRDEWNAYQRQYAANLRASSAEYRAKRSKASADYKTERERIDSTYKAERRMKQLIRTTMVKWGGGKCARTDELLGCTVAEARQHLESLFLPGMTWENHGINGWHIDHIRPCASFDDLSDIEQQKQCCNWKNLQPLWAEDNLRKSDTWEPELQAA